MALVLEHKLSKLKSIYLDVYALLVFLSIFSTWSIKVFWTLMGFPLYLLYLLANKAWSFMKTDYD